MSYKGEDELPSFNRIKMNTEIYDKQKLVEYLLGSLSEDETERIDEASFTDESFADAISAAENDLIDAYVRGELNGAKLEQFETHYLASPRRREKVKFAAAFQNLAEPEIKPEKSESFFAVFVNFLNANRLSFGFASIILVLILGGIWFFAFRRNQPENEVVIQKTPTPENKQNSSEAAVPTDTEVPSAINTENNKTPEKVNKNVNTEINRNPQIEKTPTATPPKIMLASFVLAPPLRGNQPVNFSISKQTTDVAVRLELEPNDYESYRVILTDEAGGNLRQFGNFRARGSSLNVRFPAKLLKSGVYSFVVSGTKDGATEILFTYTFRAVIK